jgi:uncharacterized protein YbaR (Trm112 family)
MIDLESSRWSELSHAYGAAGNVPRLIAGLLSGDESTVDELFSSLCHQGSIYTASYAAVPHLVDIAGRLRRPDLRTHILVLIGSIAASSDDRSDAPIAPDVRAAYETALPRARDLALETLGWRLDPEEAVYLLQAAAGLEGHLSLGRILQGFVAEEFVLKCPSCNSELYVWTDGEALSTAAEDPVTNPMTVRTAIAPGPAPNSRLDVEFRWLIQNGGKAALSAIGGRLPYLYGSGTCPACKSEFSVRDELAASVA